MTTFKLVKQSGLWAIGLVLLVTLLQAQSTTVTGVITHRNNTPAVNYLVSIGTEARYTDVRGRYRIDGLRPGRYRIRVVKEGRIVRDADVDIRGPVLTFNLDVP